MLIHPSKVLVPAVPILLSFPGLLFLRMEATASLGALMLFASPLCTGIAAAYFCRGPEAVCATFLFSIFAMMGGFALCFGPAAIGWVGVLWAQMLIAAIAGVLIGVVLRPYLRNWIRRTAVAESRDEEVPSPP